MGNISDHNLFHFQETPEAPPISPTMSSKLGLDFILDEFNCNTEADKFVLEMIKKEKIRKRPTLEKMRSGFQLDYAYELKEAISEYGLEEKIQKLSQKHKKRSRPKLKLFESAK